MPLPCLAQVGGDTGVHGWTRRANIAWLWVRSAAHASPIWPGLDQSPDWSGSAVRIECPKSQQIKEKMRCCVVSLLYGALQIPLIRDVRRDPRAIGATIFVLGLAALVSICGAGARTKPHVLACVAFATLPFLLASNIFVVTGTTVRAFIACECFNFN